MEKYSVLMSLYAKEKPEYLRLALDSMINQTVKPDEIVLVEDGPLTDELYEVVKEYGEKYPDLFNVVINKTNLGLGPALNRGLSCCRNELVARMDTDDISKSDRCEKQLKTFEEDKELSITGGQIEEFIDRPENVSGRRIVPCSDTEIKAYMKKRCPFNHVTVMFKKSDILEVGNYQEWFWNEDYYLWIRLAISNKKFANISDILVKVRVGKEMYKRRGGRKYFKSEKDIQKLMYKNGLISYSRYLINVAERLVLQVLMPNRVRGWIFKKLARN